MRNRLNFRQLETFRAVFLTGSFTRAAAHLNVTQPAVSKTMADLENGLGLRLFEREATGIVPTREAELIFAEFEKIHAGLGRLVDVVAMAADGVAGVVQCAALPIYAESLVPGLIEGFARVAPNARIILDSMRHDELVQALITGQAEVGITSVPVGLDTLAVHAEVDEPGVLIVPEGHRLAEQRAATLAELADEPFIAYPPSCPFRQELDRYFQAYDFVPRERMLVRAPGAVFQLVNRGLGVAIVQASAVEVYQGAQVRSVSLAQPFSWRCGVVTRQGAALPEVVGAFIGHAVDALRRDAAPAARAGAPGEA